MLTYFLTTEGHDVVAAADGQNALAKAQEFKPDVAILDIGMPGLNGYEVARRLRQSPAGATPVLVALSGLGQPTDKTRAAEAGFNQHFTKPVDISALMAFVATATASKKT